MTWGAEKVWGVGGWGRSSEVSRSRPSAASPKVRKLLSGGRKVVGRRDRIYGGDLGRGEVGRAREKATSVQVRRVNSVSDE